MTDYTNGVVDPAAWAEVRGTLTVHDRRQQNIKWTQKDLDETLAFIREDQKRVLKALGEHIINPLVERIKKLEAEVAELKAVGVNRGITQLRSVR